MGTTGCGKSTLAKRLAIQFKKQGKAVLVLDPIGDSDWQADFITDDKNEFLKVAKASKNCILIVDESAGVVGRYDVEMEWLGTKARHWGHSTFFIAQRTQQINPTVRNQCSNLYLFQVSGNDSDILAEEFNQDILKEAKSLPKLSFIKTGRFQEPKKFSLSF